jgi:hypothetical protein
MAVMVNDHDSAQPAPAARTRIQQGAALAGTASTAVAAGRVALGLAALARPDVPARPWVGASADDLSARVFGRALGARDLALGLGALAALRQPRPAAASWFAAGALSDALDVAATVAAWPELPRRTRWLVAATAGGAALAGAVGAVAALAEHRG